MRAMRGRLVWAAPVASALLLAAAGALRVAADLPTDKLVAEVLPNVVLGLSLPLLGAAVLAQLPRHPLGRLWVATGVVAALTVAVHSYAEAASREGLPLGVAA